MTSLRTHVQRRPATAADEPLLRELFRSTRSLELALMPWDDAAKEAFVSMQLQAQQAHQQREHPDARSEVITVDGVPAGRLVVDPGPDGVHLVDVALLPAYRGRGIGGQLLAELLAEAGELPVTLQVERGSPARLLYERLGFRVVAAGPVHDRMQRGPGAS